MAGGSKRQAPIAERLADLIGQQITDGVYRAGDKLPSLRELAHLHSYAKNTVVWSHAVWWSPGAALGSMFKRRHAMHLRMRTQASSTVRWMWSG